MEQIITPKVETTSRTVTKVKIVKVEVVPNIEATISVVLLDSNNKLVAPKKVTLTGNDYGSWGADDTYLMTKVIEKLNLL